MSQFLGVRARQNIDGQASPMAEQQSNQDKTEKPTPRRRRKAREKGQVAKSNEVMAVVVLLTGLATLYATAGYLYRNITGLMRQVLGQAHAWDVNMDTIQGFALRAMEGFFWLVLPVLVMVFVMALLVGVAQVGFMWVPSLIKPKLEKLNPLKGLKRIASKRTLMELFKSVGKVVLVGYVAYATIVGRMEDLSSLGHLTVIEILHFVCEVAFLVFLKAAAIMVVLAALDWAFNKWEYEKNLKMSKKELKDEWKQTEGDPLVKQRIRQTQMKMAQQRMMAAVPEADVVVTNPTHYAVALLYQPGAMDAPQVTAKGKDLVAKKIRELAEAHAVPLVQDPPVAQALYQVEVGETVPVELFEAVAAILAYVYRLKNRHHQYLYQEETA
ncbi:MAG: flagellar biosynthesis protein FlhB [Proteobacteria bacterium]|nr:flagellar biosynthesis protein FlhB [Pseudomonadota bacterium]